MLQHSRAMYIISYRPICWLQLAAEYGGCSQLMLTSPQLQTLQSHLLNKTSKKKTMFYIIFLTLFDRTVVEVTTILRMAAPRPLAGTRAVTRRAAETTTRSMGGLHPDSTKKAPKGNLLGLLEGEVRSHFFFIIQKTLHKYSVLQEVTVGWLSKILSTILYCNDESLSLLFFIFKNIPNTVTKPIPFIL